MYNKYKAPARKLMKLENTLLRITDRSGSSSLGARNDEEANSEQKMSDIKGRKRKVMSVMEEYLGRSKRRKGNRSQSRSKTT